MDRDSNTQPNGNGSRLVDWRLDQLEEMRAADRLTAMEAEVAALKKAFEVLGEKIDSLRGWLMKIMGGLVVALILLVINLLIKFKTGSAVS